MGRQIAVAELGSWIAGERKINYVGQPVVVRKGKGVKSLELTEPVR